MKLWLDDRRRAPAGWTRAYTVAEAQAHLQTGAVDEASLDHDLGACDACMGGLSTEEWLETHDWDMPTCEHLGTGYTLCVWMAETGHWPKQKPTVHSMNHKGHPRINERGWTGRFGHGCVVVLRHTSSQRGATTMLPGNGRMRPNSRAHFSSTKL